MVALLGVWWLLPTSNRPPDYSRRGYTSVHFETWGHDGRYEEVKGASDDPAPVTELAKVLRSGREVPLCKCAGLGILEFRHPGGRIERVESMRDESVEFTVDGRRHQVERGRFLQLVTPLGVPDDRWHKWPGT